MKPSPSVIFLTPIFLTDRTTTMKPAILFFALITIVFDALFFLGFRECV